MAFGTVCGRCRSIPQVGTIENGEVGEKAGVVGVKENADLEMTTHEY